MIKIPYVNLFKSHRTNGFSENAFIDVYGTLVPITNLPLPLTSVVPTRMLVDIFFMLMSKMKVKEVKHISELHSWSIMTSLLNWIILIVFEYWKNISSDFLFHSQCTSSRHNTP